MKKIYLLPFLLLCSMATFAQIVNIESLRMNAKDKKLSGIVDLDFAIRKNKAGQTVVIGTDVGAQWNLGRKNRLIFLSGYHLTQFNDTDDPTAPSRNFNNQAFGHFRYNIDLSKTIALEAYSQAQWDEVQEIDIRFLNGAGLRFELLQNDTASFYFGLSYMLEYEETSERPEAITTNEHQRLSTYVSGQLGLNPFLNFNYVLYFQPRPAELEDFRISSNVGLSIRLSRKVNFTTSASLLFDSRPPSTVPKTQYFLSNGIRMDF
ncbi:DUF481 domain-containing protein [Flavilitoribacter nigricans]|uniref:DUF481 domain-containing protein n=1 Tax=Flavilitoribacter nigricans (strain ATCC 23147 / DSM 23189 / NBRC 102662 / NCIMB 1420 / SS-2) TaxID=1122177 RepID=A0A2D0N6X4_FLAN2|nr:DUF481 domain-containing protein [Flavilitoribacter nigricans]PHN04148.1 hypothetical protein CRP01_23415 [Flavilitoribacter nigricans DSM 23189 = NBRC 102662]